MQQAWTQPSARGRASPLSQPSPSGPAEKRVSERTSEVAESGLVCWEELLKLQLTSTGKLSDLPRDTQLSGDSPESLAQCSPLRLGWGSSPSPAGGSAVGLRLLGVTGRNQWPPVSRAHAPVWECSQVRPSESYRLLRQLRMPGDSRATQWDLAGVLPPLNRPGSSARREQGGGWRGDFTPPPPPMPGQTLCSVHSLDGPTPQPWRGEEAVCLAPAA